MGKTAISSPAIGTRRLVLPYILSCPSRCLWPILYYYIYLLIVSNKTLCQIFPSCLKSNQFWGNVIILKRLTISFPWDLEYIKSFYCMDNRAFCNPTNRKNCIPSTGWWFSVRDMCIAMTFYDSITIVVSPYQIMILSMCIAGRLARNGRGITAR